MITGIDIGTGSIKAVSAIYNGDTSEFEVMAKVGLPVSGVRRGVVTNSEEVSAVIAEAIKNIEIQTNQKVEGAYLNLNGSHISSLISKGQVAVSRADQKISSEDIDRVIQAAKIFPVTRNKEIVEVFPKEYVIDGVGGIKDPLDMQGLRFEADVLIIEAFSQYIRNTSQAVLDANLKQNDLVIGILAASEAVLDPREKERGVAILDIGAGTSSLAVFEEGLLLHIAVFPLGANNITNDIAIGLKCDVDTAEKIKLEFGSAVGNKSDAKKERIDSLESGKEVVFTRAILRKIIDARVTEIFDLTKEELKKISKDELLPDGIVLTGGGALLPGIADLARKEFKLSCRVASPKKFNLPIDDPRFSTVCGLIVRGHQSEGEEEHGSFSKITEAIKNFFKSLIP